MVIFVFFFLLCFVILAFAWGYDTGRERTNQEAEQAKGASKEKERQQQEWAQGVRQQWTEEVKRGDGLEAELKKVKGQKKSSEVRTGQIVEQLAPFLEGFPYDPKRASFLGAPIDFVVFTDDAVRFVEVKSGKSQLSSTQRRIRDQINRGAVSFEVYRVRGA